MGVEDDIRKLLVEGHPVAEVINLGYKRATVYKVNQELESAKLQPYHSPWVFTYKTNKGDFRFLPGESMLLNWTVTNQSGADLYIFNAGVEPEWLRTAGEWYPTQVNALVRDRQAKTLPPLKIPIPEDIPLGDYDLRFGLQLQHLVLDPCGYPPHEIQWCVPHVVEIKYPRTCRIFFSHSTQNIPAVRQLQRHFDLYGYEAVIAEDIQEPGRFLPEKFQAQIRQSDYFFALLTHEAALSAWVLMEIRYAAFELRGKPLILLKEEGVTLPEDIGLIEYWETFGRAEPITSLAEKVNKAISYFAGTPKALAKKVELPIGWVLLGAGLVFLSGFALGRRE